MRLAVTLVRYLLGAAFLVFGLNGFLSFIPQPPPPASGGAFLGALVEGHVMTLVKVVETLAGVLLLAGRAVPLALATLTPVLTGIVLYHLTYDVAGGVPGYVFAALAAFLVWAFRAQFVPLLAPASAARVDAR